MKKFALCLVLVNDVNRVGRGGAAVKICSISQHLGGGTIVFG